MSWYANLWREIGAAMIEAAWRLANGDDCDWPSYRERLDNGDCEE